MAHNRNVLIKVWNDKKVIKGDYWAIRNLTPTAFYIYIHLMNVNEDFRPSINGYVQIAQCGIRKVRNAINELKEKGYLETKLVAYNTYSWTVYASANKTLSAITPRKKRKKKVVKEINPELLVEKEQIEELLKDNSVFGDIRVELEDRLIEIEKEINK